jgi:CHAT domain-containing protein
MTGREYDPKTAAQDDKVIVLTNKTATLRRLYEAAQGSRYVHLATHGLTDTSGAAVYSALALTRPKRITMEDTGVLTLARLLDEWWARLDSTELVVLSACDTATGRVISGEGVFSLSWGFMYAGTPAVIASLWPVADDSTAELMSNLYREIAESERRESSAAKLEAFVKVREALRKKYPEPYFWAPFIYMGDPR